MTQSKSTGSQNKQSGNLSEEDIQKQKAGVKEKQPRPHVDREGRQGQGRGRRREAERRPLSPVAGENR
jgi:hypothetical protein